MAQRKRSICIYIVCCSFSVSLSSLHLLLLYVIVSDTDCRLLDGLHNQGALSICRQRQPLPLHHSSAIAASVAATATATELAASAATFNVAFQTDERISTECTVQKCLGLATCGVVSFVMSLEQRNNLSQAQRPRIFLGGTIKIVSSSVRKKVPIVGLRHSWLQDEHTHTHTHIRALTHSHSFSRTHVGQKIEFMMCIYIYIYCLTGKDNKPSMSTGRRTNERTNVERTKPQSK